jgi:hypothetical protein
MALPHFPDQNTMHATIKLDSLHDDPDEEANLRSNA